MQRILVLTKPIWTLYVLGFPAGGGKSVMETGGFRRADFSPRQGTLLEIWPVGARPRTLLVP